MTTGRINQVTIINSIQKNELEKKDIQLEAQQCKPLLTKGKHVHKEWKRF